MYKEYENLLGAIVKNSSFLKDISVEILRESLKKQTKIEKLTWAAYAQNFLFAFTDEVGKFYLVKSLYPKKLSILQNSSIGFRSHDKKMESIISIIDSKRKGINNPFTIKQSIEILKKFKSQTLYVDYKDGKIFLPSFSSTLNNITFNNYINFILALDKMVKFDLELFKKEQK
ncbi:MAG: hypothetical protein WC229_00525 [Candidatus Paceibacterota bacterium]|jgi:hypothetical protein